MKRIKLLHNPKAGDEEHSKKELVSLIEEHGYECRYSSTKKEGWKNIEEDTDLVVVAGGDGTVRKVAKVLLEKEVPGGLPLAILPVGTANNIAKTLGIEGNTPALIHSWRSSGKKRFDVGRICGWGEDRFFVESFGFGIFPYLIRRMAKEKMPDNEMPDEKLNRSLKMLHRLIDEYEPKRCSLEIEGIGHSGEFIMVEMMNTRSLGPNLELSPLGDPGDGLLDVVLIAGKEKQTFADYLAARIKGADEIFPFPTLPANNIRINWEGTHAHIDDRVLKIDKSALLRVELKNGMLEILSGSK